MDQITVQEIQKLTEICLRNIKSDELYRLRNDAKLRAVNNSKSYDEFKWEVDTIKFWYNAKHHFLSNTTFFCYLYLSPYVFRDIVDAAHLKPLSRHDKMNSQTNKSRWNSQIWIMFVFSLAAAAFSVATEKNNKKISGECEKANKLPVERQRPIVPYFFVSAMPHGSFLFICKFVGHFVVSISLGIINWQIN